MTTTRAKRKHHIEQLARYNQVVERKPLRKLPTPPGWFLRLIVMRPPGMGTSVPGAMGLQPAKDFSLAIAQYKSRGVIEERLDAFADATGQSRADVQSIYEAATNRNS